MDSLMLGLTASLVQEIQEKQQPQVEGHSKPEDAAPHSPGTSRPMEVDSEGRSDESMRNGDPILQSKHKIFLSHSGAQKDFVDQLCGDLEKHRHFPFLTNALLAYPRV